MPVSGACAWCVLDDVLTAAEHPVGALREASRLLRPGGRLLLLFDLAADGASAARTALAGWCAESGLRVAAPRLVPSRDPAWLLSVATQAGGRSAETAAA